jgi:DNA mismatch endonuclease (patch repair protein)
MLANRSINTRPERALGSAIHQLGLRYRKHVVVKVGMFQVRVDFLFSTARLALFLDGCFWHRCLRHRRQVPVRNGEWWSRKLEATARRDRRQRAALKRHGWTVIRVWEHEDPVTAARSIAKRLRRPRPR